MAVPEFPDSITISVRKFALLTGVLVVFLTGIGVGAFLKPPGPGFPGPRTWAAVERSESAPSVFARVAATVEPSVVHITTLDGIGNEIIGQGTGSGFVVDPKGFVLTNFHVVKTATRIRVKFQDATELGARLVASDEETDLAVLKVEARNPLSYVKFGDSEAVRVGDWVVAIGSPFGLDQTVTVGIISAKERVTDKRRSLQQFLQTDAAINPGNSGGPLLNMNGEVVGINTQIATTDGRFNGIGFAIPSTQAKTVYQQLITTGRVSRGYLGVFLDRVSGPFANVYGIPNGQGALIQYVDDYGPAKDAGLQGGDVIVEFQGRPVADDRDLIRQVAAAAVGTQATVRYFREGKSLTARLTIDERPGDSRINGIVPPRLQRRTDDEPAARSVPPLRPSPKNLGLLVGTLTPLRARQSGLDGIYTDGEKGVLVLNVDPNGVGFEARLRENDVIVAVNRVPVRDEKEFAQVVKGLGSNDDVVFAIKRIQPGARRVVSNYLWATIP